MRIQTLRPYLAVTLALLWSIACVQAQFTFSHVGGGPTGTLTPNAEPGSFTLAGGGNDIWDMGDEFSFAHVEITGDFDISVRLESIEAANRWTKAGIMAREALVPEARMAFAKGSPFGPSAGNANCGEDINGAADVSLMYRTWIPNAGGNGGQHEDRLVADPGYPSHKWVRLQREGDIIRGYTSTDGVNWLAPQVQNTATWVTPVGGAPTPLAQTLQVGLAVSRHGCAVVQSATVEFRALQAAQISRHPENRMVDQGFPATFQIGLAGLADWTVEWLENGTPIPGATGRSYTTAPAVMSDDGKRYSVRATDRLSGAVLTSTEAVLTVVADLTPPTVVSASTPFTSGTELNVVFSEPVNQADAENLANYSLPGVALNSAALQADSRTVSITAGSSLYDVSCLTLAVNNVRDRAVPPNTMAAASVPVITAKGSIRYLQYDAIGGVAVANLTTHPKFPNAPDRVVNNPEFENPDQGGNNFNDYGAMLQGYVHPPVSGDYRFYIAADDGAALWLSTDENPANKVQIAAEPIWSVYRGYNGTGGGGGGRACPGPNCNISEPITLQAGCKYFVEFIYKEGGGGDYGSVAWQLPGGPPPADGSAPIQAAFLSPYQIAASIPADQPADITATEGRFVTFTADIQGTFPRTIQWYRDGSPITGANGTSLTVGPLLHPEDNGATFSVTVQNDVNTVNSRTATLTVIEDTEPPDLVAAAGSTTLDRITATYNEIVDEVTAGDEFSYIIEGGLTPVNVIAADLQADGRTVLLTLDPSTPLNLNSAYNVIVGGIADISGNVLDTDSASFHSVVEGCGGIVFEAYNTGNIGNRTAVNLLTTHPSFPDSPDFTATIPGLDSRLAYPTDVREDYGARMRGVYVPPYSGQWILYLRSDDASELWMNPNGIDPAGKEKIAEELGCCRAFEAIPSRTLDLIGGRPYYIEVLYKEGGGGDYAQVAARTVGSADPLVPVGARDVGQFAEPGFSGALTVNGPTDQSVIENRIATFSVTAESSMGLPICYQWSRDGVPIVGANGASYSLQAALSDNGAVFTVRVSIVGNVVDSAAATLNVGADVVAPTVASASGTDTLRHVMVRFDEIVESGTAGDEFNYTIAGLDVNTADLLADGQTVKLGTSAQTPGTIYTVMVSGVTDIASSPNPIGSEGTADFTAWTFSPGFLRLDYYGGQSTTDNVLDTTLLASPKYPDFPDQVHYLSAFDTRTVFPDNSREGYGARVSGVYIPPASGNWVFYLASDDSSRLFLNVNGYDPTGNALIVEEPACCGVWTAHVSGPQALTGGSQYSIAGIYKEGTGGDYLKVAAGLEGTPPPPDNPNQQMPVSAYAIPAQNIGVYTDPTTGASGNIIQQPADVTACLNPLVPDQAPVTLTVGVDTAPAGVASHIQWQRLSGSDWVNVASGPSYSFVPSLSDNGAQFRAVLYVLGLSAPITSGEATLSVFQANTPPAFDLASSASSAEDAGPQSVAGAASNISVHSIPRTPVAFATAFDSAAGLTLYGVATVADGALKLTTPVNSVNGAAAVDAPVQNYESIEVAWKSYIGGGAGGGADGYTLNIGDNIPGDPAASGAPAEEGHPGADLTVSVDTFNNAELRNPDEGIQVKWGTTEIAFQNIPKDNPGDGNYLRKSAFVDAKLTVDSAGLATLVYDGNTISGQIPDYTGVRANRLVFWARTGGANDNQWIDDLDIQAFPFDRSSAESSQTVAFEVSNDNPGLFSAQPAISPDGTLTYAGAPDAHGSATVSVVARDDGGIVCNGDDVSDAKTFTITITPMNDCPVATAPAPYTVASGGSIPITLTGTDVDGDALTASVATQPTCGTLSVQGGQLHYTANVTSTACNDVFTFTVSDGTCTSDPATVSVTVIPNAPPVCVGTITPGECGVTFPHNGQTYAIAVKKDYVCLALNASGSTDADGDPLTATWVIDGTNSVSGMVVTNCFDVGTHTVTLIVSDGKTTCQQDLSITVIEPSEAVEQLIALVESTHVERKNKRPMIVSLKAAKAAFDRDGWKVGAQMLRVFEYKVIAQIYSRNPAEALMFIDAAENIINAVKCVIKQPRKGDDDGDDDEDRHRDDDDGPGNGSGHHGDDDGGDDDDGGGDDDDGGQDHDDD